MKPITQLPTYLRPIDFFNKTGMMAIGSRLRMLSERITTESAKIYSVHEAGLQTR